MLDCIIVEANAHRRCCTPVAECRTGRGAPSTWGPPTIAGRAVFRKPTSSPARVFPFSDVFFRSRRIASPCREMASGRARKDFRKPPKRGLTRGGRITMLALVTRARHVFNAMSCRVPPPGFSHALPVPSGLPGQPGRALGLISEKHGSILGRHGRARRVRPSWSEPGGWSAIIRPSRDRDGRSARELSWQDAGDSRAVAGPLSSR